MSSFCSAKATHIFSAKNIRILYIESVKIVNEMTLNELVKLTMLWTTGPWYFSYFSSKNICCGYSLEVPHWGTSNEYPQNTFSCRNKKKYIPDTHSYLNLCPQHCYMGNSRNLLLIQPGMIVIMEHTLKCISEQVWASKTVKTNVRNILNI